MKFNIIKTLDEVGDDDHTPEPQVIKPMWLFSWIRWPIRFLSLGFVLLDSMAQKLAKKIIKPPFVQKGACKKRGNCCYYIMVAKVNGPFGFLDRFWHTQINGFFLRSSEPVDYEGKKMWVMGCRYLKKGKCSIYRFRPTVCRNWPRIEAFSRPQMLKGCGFKAKARETKKSCVKAFASRSSQNK